MNEGRRGGARVLANAMFRAETVKFLFNFISADNITTGHAGLTFWAATLRDTGCVGGKVERVVLVLLMEMFGKNLLAGGGWTVLLLFLELSKNIWTVRFHFANSFPFFENFFKVFFCKITFSADHSFLFLPMEAALGKMIRLKHLKQ